MMLAQMIINFAIFCLLVFVGICVLVVVPIALFVIDGTRPFIVSLLYTISFPLLAILMKVALKALVVDYFLVEHGQPIYPYLFSPLWVVLIVLNFVQAVYAGVFRYLYLVVVAIVQCSFIHTTILPEKYIALDPGYFSFICLTFTQSSRRNLLRRAFITLLMPQVQRLHSE